MTAVAERGLAGELGDLAEAEMARWHVPGMAVGLYRDGEFETAAFGLASLETAQPVTPDTLFQIGSISKVFTATALMQLVDEWKVELDAPVARYLAGFRLSTDEATESLTVRHLLTHTGGFWGDDFTAHGVGDDALEKAVAALANVRQLTAPGETWSYCNAGFQVMGRIIETFGRQPVEDVIRKRVFQPLCLERSTFWAHEAITFPAAIGYNKPLEPEKENQVGRPYPITRAMHPAGAIIGTVGDLLKFAAFHMGDGTADGKRVLGPAAMKMMQEPQVRAANMAPHWGLGWWIEEAGGVRVLGHGGSTNGFRATLKVCPERNFAVAALTNGSNGSAVNRAIDHWAFEHYLGLKRESPQPIAMTPAQLAKFAGRYHTPNGDGTVAVEGSGLRLEGWAKSGISGEETQLPTRHALPVSDREFLITDTEMAGSTFDFLFNADGTIRFRRLGGRLADKVS